MSETLTSLSINSAVYRIKKLGTRKENQDINNSEYHEQMVMLLVELIVTNGGTVR